MLDRWSIKCLDSCSSEAYVGTDFMGEVFS